ncbi:MAG: ABC transporter permease [Gemmatimonadaceae bacterium]
MSTRFVLRRLLQVVPTVAGILLVSFVLVHAAPGDPVLALAGEHGDARYYADMRRHFGLDQPLPRQLVTYAGRVAHGDLGFSYVQGRSAAAVVMERVPATTLLTGTALLVAIMAAVPLGTLAGRRPFGARDVGVSALALGLYSAPVFWIGQLAILVIALRFGLAPVQGMITAGGDVTGLARAANVLRHLALPALVLASQELAVFVRLTRSGVIDELTRDHVRTARAKGVGERAVLLRHALPRALLPVVTVIGARAGHLVAGAAVVEIVFGWPGTGRLMLDALQTRDTPVLLALFLLVSLAVVLVNLATDLAYAAIDPRVRLR